jgi:hypothetical protein
MERPLGSFGASAAEVVAEGLRALRPAVLVLERTIEQQLARVQGHDV